MLIHDDIFSWKGFGGMLDLAAGKCRLRIFDLTQGPQQKVAHIKPMVVVVSDLPSEPADLKRVSVRSCSSHIATRVAAEFNIPYQRMVFVEYYPASTYGEHNEHHIPAKFDAVEFVWHDDRAMHPKWRALESPLVAILEPLIHEELSMD